MRLHALDLSGLLMVMAIPLLAGLSRLKQMAKPSAVSKPRRTRRLPPRLGSGAGRLFDAW